MSSIFLQQSVIDAPGIHTNAVYPFRLPPGNIQRAPHLKPKTRRIPVHFFAVIVHGIVRKTMQLFQR